jgi:hypothetical protein
LEQPLIPNFVSVGLFEPEQSSGVSSLERKFIVLAMVHTPIRKSVYNISWSGKFPEQAPGYGPSPSNQKNGQIAGPHRILCGHIDSNLTIFFFVFPLLLKQFKFFIRPKDAPKRLSGVAVEKSGGGAPGFSSRQDPQYIFLGVFWFSEYLNLELRRPCSMNVSPVIH